MAITIYDLKPRFQRLLRPLARRLAATAVTANQLRCLLAIHVRDLHPRTFTLRIGRGRRKRFAKTTERGG